MSETDKDNIERTYCRIITDNTSDHHAIPDQIRDMMMQYRYDDISRPMVYFDKNYPDGIRDIIKNTITKMHRSGEIPLMPMACVFPKGRIGY